MIPILFIVAAIATVALTSNRPSPRTRAALPPARAPSSLDRIAAITQVGGVPPEWMVDAAVAEAYAIGDWRTAVGLSTTFEKRPLPTESEESSREEPVSNESADPVPAESPPAPVPRTYPLPELPPQSLLAIAKPEEWHQFVEALRTDEPTFEAERHVGAWRLRKDRMKQLGIAPENLKDDETAQYQAFVSECLVSLDKGRDLVNQYLGDHIEVRGEKHVITTSGLLGVMKAAGIKNAGHWLANPKQRDEFPFTTELFLKANNCF